MKFSAYWEAYKKEPYQTDDIICVETGMEILYDLRQKLQAGANLHYYLIYQDSMGEMETNPAYVCYDAYKRNHSVAFEPVLRKHRVNNPKGNAELCKRFGIPPLIGMTFDTLKKDGIFKDQKQLVDTARNWCTRRKFKNSLLIGGKNNGIGKTTAGICTLMEYYIQHDLHEAQGWRSMLDNSILFIKERDLFQLIRESYHNNESSLSEAQILYKLCRVDFLMYDDLFSVADNDFAKRILFTLVDERVECKGLPTVFTTRYAELALKKNFPDIYSRLQRGTIYYADTINVDFRNPNLKGTKDGTKEKN